MKFTYTHRGLLDRSTVNIQTDLAFGDEIRVTRDRTKPAEDELRGLCGVFVEYTKNGYARIMPNDYTTNPHCVNGYLLVHPESLIWLRHNGEMFDAYTDSAEARCYCSSLAGGRCDFCTGIR